MTQDFEKQVFEMRRLQKEYIKTKNSLMKKKAIRAECDVDKYFTEKGFEIDNSKTQTLF